MAWAVGNLATVQAVGEWVWILDDDDECVCPDLIGRLKQAPGDAEVVIVKMQHGEPLGILPDPAVWGQEPQRQRIGTSAFIVRRDVWNATHHLWQAQYAGDFYYIHGLWTSGRQFFWLDLVASRTQRGMMKGRRE